MKNPTRLLARAGFGATASTAATEKTAYRSRFGSLRRASLVLALLPLAALSACDSSPMADSSGERAVVTRGVPQPDVAMPVRITGDELESRFAALKQAAASKRSILKPQLSVTADGGISITVPDDYPTIQAAVDAAPPGATITVKEGTYVEPGGVFVNTPDLTIVGKDATQVGGFGIFADGVTLESFRIIFDDFAGILAFGNGIAIRKNEVSGPDGVACTWNVCQVGIGFRASEVTVEQNTVSGTGFGILSVGSNDVVIDRNTVSGTTIAGAIQLESSSTEHTITNNTMTSNMDGIVLYYSSENTLAKNEISQTGLNGIFLGFSYLNVLKNNTSTDAAYASIFLHSSTENELSNNTAGGSVNGILLNYAHDNSVAHNKANENSGNGIYVYGAWENVVTFNEAGENSKVGIQLEFSGLNIVEMSTALENADCDIRDVYGDNNTIQKNEAECIEAF